MEELEKITTRLGNLDDIVGELSVEIQSIKDAGVSGQGRNFDALAAGLERLAIVVDDIIKAITAETYKVNLLYEKMSHIETKQKENYARLATRMAQLEGSIEGLKGLLPDE